MLTIAYDGTDFCGWQKQESPAGGFVDPGKILIAGDPGTLPQEHRAVSGSTRGMEGVQPDEPAAERQGTRERITLRTVQEVVERAVREVVREPVDVLGASRTDAGVHARGQVAAFTCSDHAWPAERGAGPLLRAVNARLPEDVLVVGAKAVAESFSPISDCTGKGYSYTLHVSPHRPIWDRRYVHHVWTPLDVDRMNQAAAKIVGEHDFAAFAAAGHGRLSTVRRVFACRVLEESELARQRDSETAKRLRIEVSGNGFLWNMVRIIAGTLVEVGRGRMTPEGVTAAIESRDRRKAGPTLPPTGLCLEWVRYDGG